MLYIFDVVGTPCLKLGYTNGCPWEGVRDGFWKLDHLASCCGKVGWDDLDLLYLTLGDMADEALINELVPPLEGEFWDRQQLEMLTLALKVHLRFRHELGNDIWKLPLPPKPLAPAVGRGI